MDDKHGRLAAALQAAKSEGSRQDNRVDQREKKKQSRQHYLRRKLDKDIRNYVKSRSKYQPVRSRDIDTIGRKHGFQSYDVGELSFGDGK